MQIISPPPGLNAYPGQGIGQGIKDIGNSISQMIMMKKTMDDQKAQRKLELFLKEGELTGELSKPTPELQKAFKKYYGVQPTGIFAEGGKTLAGREKEAEIGKTKAYTEFLTRRDIGKTDAKGLDYAVKYANAKLGKPFEVLGDEERTMWQSYYDEGITNWGIFTKKNGTTSGDASKSTEALAFRNQWKVLPKAQRDFALSDTNYRLKLESKLKAIGLSLEDLNA